jgi:hypothetical protein
MPIKFDSVEELTNFYQSFDTVDSPKLAATAKEESPEKLANSAETPSSKNTSPRPPAFKAQVNKAGKSFNLTAEVRNIVQKQLDKKASFTMNTIYTALAKKNPSINKMSAISAISKHMNTTFKFVSFSEQPGQGKRPMKLYNPAN